MIDHASISPEVLSRYAADAALSVEGVSRVAERALTHRRGVSVDSGARGLEIELRLAVEWGSDIPGVGRAVQQRVREYLARMAGVDAAVVDVVVDEVA